MISQIMTPSGAARVDQYGVVPRGVGRRYHVNDAHAMANGLHAPTESGRSATALDYFTNAAARMGWGTPSLMESTDYNLVRLSFNYILLITMYRNHWISRRIVEIPAKDMVRAWPRLTSDIEPDDLSRIDRSIRRTRTKSKILDAMRWARLFGGAGCLIVIDGHENRLDEPIDLDTIEPGAYRGLIPFDMWSGITPRMDVSTNINKPLNFGLPESYSVGSSDGGPDYEVHSSRILRFIGPSVPTPELQAQSWWGISALEPAFEEIRKRDNLSWNILSVSFRANLLGITFPELAQALSGASMNLNALVAFEQRMQAMNQMLSNQSMLMLPKDGDLKSVQQNMTGWADVYQQFQLDISGAAQIPVTRLFGRTLTGLGQSNDADERIYEEFIAMEQDEQLRPALDTLYPVICMSELGEHPKDLDLTFPSIRVLDDKEKVEMAKAVGDNVVSLFNAGIYDKPMSLKEIKQASDVTGFGTNITDDDIAKAEEEAAMMPPGGMPGEMPGAGGGGMGPQQGPAGPGGPGGGVPAKGGPGSPGKAPGGPELVKPGIAAAARQQQQRPQAPRQPVKSERDPGKLDALSNGTGNHFRQRPASGKAPVVKTLKFAGIPISLEFFAGSRRRITNPRGEVVYDRQLPNHYGYVTGTTGRDGDEIDVIVGKDPAAPMAYIVDMIDRGPDPEAREDEDKVLLGFPDEESAKEAFLAMYPEDFFGGMEEMPVYQFRTQWLDDDHDDVQPSRAADWEESEHPRGQPKNAGQFVSGGGGGSAKKEEAAPAASKQSGGSPTAPAEKAVTARHEEVPVATKEPEAPIAAGKKSGRAEAPAGPGEGPALSEQGWSDLSHEEQLKVFQTLKNHHAKLNTRLLKYVKNPTAPEVQDIMDEMEDLVHQWSRMHLDTGDWVEGIGKPGGPKDVLVIGGGPGGMASAIMGGTDGMDTMVVESQSKTGGQSRYSSRIENYPGFLIGVEGQDLADNMYGQAHRLGANILTSTKVTSLTYDPKTDLKTVTFDNGETVTARAVIVATGVSFKHMDFPGNDSPDIVYGNGDMIRDNYEGKPVVIVGGSNGAAQAALGAAETAKDVYLMSRSKIEKGMSEYQVLAVRNNPKIHLIVGDEIAQAFLDDNDHVTGIQTKNGQKIDAAAIGLFVGSAPKNEWLPSSVKRNEEGKIETNQYLETPMPGVFAIGDTRADSIGRVGAAVGDGQMAEKGINLYFERMKEKEAHPDLWSAIKRRFNRHGHAFDAEEVVADNYDKLDELITQLFAYDRSHPMPLSEYVEAE